MTRPCKVCGLEVDCEHRNPVLSDPTTKPTEIHEILSILSGCYDDGVKAGLRRAVEIVKGISKSKGDSFMDYPIMPELLIAAIEAELHV